MVKKWREAILLALFATFLFIFLIFYFYQGGIKGITGDVVYSNSGSSAKIFLNSASSTCWQSLGYTGSNPSHCNSLRQSITQEMPSGKKYYASAAFKAPVGFSGRLQLIATPWGGEISQVVTVTGTGEWVYVKTPLVTTTNQKKYLEVRITSLSPDKSGTYTEWADVGVYEDGSSVNLLSNSGSFSSVDGIISTGFGGWRTNSGSNLQITISDYLLDKLDFGLPFDYYTEYQTPTLLPSSISFKGYDGNSFVGSCKLEHCPVIADGRAFFGDKKYLRLDNSYKQDIGQLTVFAKVQRQKDNNWERIVSQYQYISSGNEMGSFVLMTADRNRVYCAMRIGSSWKSVYSKDNSLSADGKEHNIICSYNGNSLIIYVDGQESGRYSGLSGSVRGSNLPIIIGASGDLTTTQNHFSGNINDIRIYSRALGQYEIRRLSGFSLTCEETLLLPKPEQSSLKEYGDIAGVLIGGYSDRSLSLYDSKAGPEYDEKLTNIVSKEYHFLMGANVYGKMHNKKGEFNWSSINLLKDFTARNNLKAMGGALIWDDDTSPSWLKFNTNCEDWKASDSKKQELADIMKLHIQSIMTQAGDNFFLWEVVNEPPYPTREVRVASTCWYKVFGEDYISMAFKYAAEAKPSAILMLNDDFGIGRNSTNKVDAFFDVVSRAKSKGARIDAVGLQMHLGKLTDDVPNSKYTSEFEYFLNKANEQNLKVFVTEMDVHQGVPPLLNTNEFVYGVGAFNYELSNGFKKVPAVVPSSNPLIIGAGCDSTGNCQNYFSGSIDEVKFYNRALSISEISSANYLSNKLVSNWTFDEASLSNQPGQVKDSASNNHGTPFNGAKTVSGKTGMAVNLNSALKQYVSFNNPPTLNENIQDFSISLYVNPSSLTGWQRIISKYYSSGSNQGSWVLMTGDKNDLYAAVNLEGKWISVRTLQDSLNKDAWQRIDLVYNMTDFTIFINGVQSTSETSLKSWDIVPYATSNVDASSCGDLNAPKISGSVNLPYRGEYYLRARAKVVSPNVISPNVISPNNKICVSVDGQAPKEVSLKNGNWYWNKLYVNNLSEGTHRFEIYSLGKGNQFREIVFDASRLDSNTYGLDRQKQIYKEMVAVCVKSQNCEGFMTWGISDIKTWIRDWIYLGEAGEIYRDYYPDARPLLFDYNYQKKPSYYGVMEGLVPRDPSC